MERKKIKIVIVGAGAVGTSTAFDLSIQGICDEIMLVDINEKKAFAEAMDMQQSVAYQNRHIAVRSGGICRLRRCGHRGHHRCRAICDGAEKAGYDRSCNEDHRFHRSAGHAEAGFMDTSSL